MSRFCRETEDCHVGRKHCRTCVCNKVDPIRKPLSPKMSPYRSHYTSVRRETLQNQGLYRNCCHPPVVDYEERERYHDHEQVFKKGYHHASSTRIERNAQSDNKFAILEKWFKEFDFDGNGLIDVYELQRLLHYLGVECDQDYVKDLIEDSDRDHDGMLSFSDFLYMWSEAANGDVVALANVIRKHDLRPDIFPSASHENKFNSRSLHIKEVRKHEPHIESSCCEFVPKRNSGRKGCVNTRELEIKSRIKRVPSQYSEDLPLFSCHR